MVAQVPTLPGHILQDFAQLREERAKEARAGHEEEQAEDLQCQMMGEGGVWGCQRQPGQGGGGFLVLTINQYT